MSRAALLVLISSTLLLGAQRASAQESESRFHAERVQRHYLDEVDEAIARANQVDVITQLPPLERERQWEGASTVSSVFVRFFGTTAPNTTGIERPSVDDHPLEELEVPLGNHLSYVLLGSANYHLLTPTHFFQQLDGVHALRYDVVPHDEGNPVRLAVSASPLYGSITTLTRHSGVDIEEQLPFSAVIGGAVGVDAFYDGPVFAVHARAWAMPGADVVNGGRFGVSTVQSIQAKWHASETLGGDPTWPIDVGILALHLDRGEARSAVYDYDGDFRSPRELRDLWQVTAFVELRVD